MVSGSRVGTLPDAVAFPFGDDGVRLSRRIDVFGVTRFLGTGPRVHIHLANCTSGHNSRRTGEVISREHTGTMARIFIGGCKVTGSHVAARFGNADAGFRGSS